MTKLAHFGYEGKGQEYNKKFDKEAAKEAVLSKQGGGFDPFAATLEVVELTQQLAQVAVFVFIQHLVAFELGEYLKLVTQGTVGNVALVFDLFVNVHLIETLKQLNYGVVKLFDLVCFGYYLPVVVFVVGSPGYGFAELHPYNVEVGDVAGKEVFLDVLVLDQ